ncbi:MAG: sporulation protein YunB, partial [Alteromonadaceae bacterium]|nr:sporulation protein YunB [Alteromonadaceae bacterium]
AALLLLFGVVYLLNQQAESTLMKLAKARVKNISQEAVTHGIDETRKDVGSDLEKLMMLKKSDGGDLEYVDVSPEISAKVYAIASEKIEGELKELGRKNFGIPLGAIFQSSLFTEVGPEIPLKIWPKGATKVELVPKMEAKGINTVQVTLYLKVANEMDIVIPANHDGEVQIDYTYPFHSIILPGEVPDNYFYYNNDGKGKGVEGPLPVVPVPGK